MKWRPKFAVSESANTIRSPRATDSARHIASPLPTTGPKAGISSASS